MEPWSWRPQYALLLASLLCPVGQSANSSSSVEARTAACSFSGPRQSPVNIDPQDVFEVVAQSLRLEYGVWNLSLVERETSEDLPGVLTLRFIGPEGGGRIQVGPRSSDFDEYVLRQIRVRTPSEHTFLGRQLPLEVQLWHEPVIHRDLHLLRVERGRIQDMLARFHDQVLHWGTKVQHLQGSSSANAFPDLQTERDWATAARKRSNEDGQNLILDAEALQRQIGLIDEKVASLNSELSRPNSARMVALSVLFRSQDTSAPAASEAGRLFRWLRAAGALRAEDASHPPADAPGAAGVASNRLSEGTDEAFEFESLSPASKDTPYGSLARSVFTYEGSFTRPPCTPVVRWFLVSEPTPADFKDLLAFASSMPGGLSRKSNISCAGEPGCLGSGVWWSGPLKETAEALPKLAKGDITSASLSFGAFKEAAHAELSSDMVAQMPWRYIKACCSVFLICSVFMLGTTCSMWSHQCCDE